MTWTIEQKLAALLRLPWTLRVQRDAAEGYFIAECTEMPEVTATATDERLLDRELWAAMETALRARIDDDDVVLPRGTKVRPWEAARRTPGIRIVRGQRGSAWESVSDPATALSGPALERSPAE